MQRKPSQVVFFYEFDFENENLGEKQFVNMFIDKNLIATVKQQIYK